MPLFSFTVKECWGGGDAPPVEAAPASEAHFPVLQTCSGLLSSLSSAPIARKHSEEGALLPLPPPGVFQAPLNVSPKRACTGRLSPLVWPQKNERSQGTRRPRPCGARRGEARQGCASPPPRGPPGVLAAPAVLRVRREQAAALVPGTSPARLREGKQAASTSGDR